MTTFFPAPEPTPAQAQLVETLCNALYDALRPQYIQLRDTDDLADLVDVLRQVVHADAMSHRDTPAGRLLEPTVQRIVSDVQGRLMFRAAVRALCSPVRARRATLLCSRLPCDGARSCDGTGRSGCL